MFDWSEYLELAKNLTGASAAPTQDAKLRAAISRAYYSVFCSARSYLEAKGKTFTKSGQVHSQVRKKLRAEPSQVLKQTATDLTRLWSDRKHADYDDHFPGALEKTAIADVQLADRAINGLRNP